MTTALQGPPTPPEVAPGPASGGPIPEREPYFFSVEDFHHMLDAGVFPSEARVGLWDGWIYGKMAKAIPHVLASINVVEALVAVKPPGWSLSVENPVAIAPRRVPLPDFTLIRGRSADYKGRKIEAADVGLIVEPSDSSLKVDTGVKLAGYAAAGLPTYWVINLIDDVVQAYEEPVPAEGRYASTKTYRRGESIPLSLDGAVVGHVAASDPLPPPVGYHEADPCPRPPRQPCSTPSSSTSWSSWSWSAGRSSSAG